ncbi:MAG TPA: AAA family ATPase [Albitalea sp.]|uniref:AAA family ATPase n=1 Tax=Piscinibacter sp. TaxID=1903157 RepID=UPI002ED48067
MALLDEMLAWAAYELKPWQSDAVRRLFQQVTLDDGDYDDLLLMLKGTRGLAGDVMPTPVPLAKAHLPTAGAANPIVLEALHSLRHVNRLAEGQRLEFLPKGLTVVFGDNGAGKSGYSRVIKSACRARVKNEPVLPNAGLEARLQQTPEAVFTVSWGDGKSFDVPWKANGTAPQDLASVAILDTRCARAYTDQEGEVLFAPYGLDVLEDLARVVFPRLERAIRQEITGLAVSDKAFFDLKPADTAVGQFLRQLSAWTKDAAIEQALQFSEENAARLEVLTAALAEKSPAEKAREWDELATRIAATAQALEDTQTVVTDDALTALRQVDEDLRVALEAETLAANQLRGDEGLLEGTGQGPWRQLFTAAQAFVGAHQHSTTPGAPCPLCQTPLAEQAASRLQRFAQFVANDASVRADGQRTRHQRTFAGLRTTPLRARLEETTVTYIESNSAGWTAAKDAFEATVESRRQWALDAGLRTHDWSKAPSAYTTQPIEAARQLEGAVREQARILREAQPGPARATLQKEADELKARQALSERCDALYELVQAKRLHRQLSDCLEDLKTKPVSDKAGQLAESAVTRQLSDALNQEFEKLGISHLQTSLKARTERGRQKLKLVLDLPNSTKPEEILSEGEQRVIAIGSFFAELSVAHHRGAAVFDDPVSSLDHQRRQRVARRLVEEAKTRQVVVFTHDTVFLAELLLLLKGADAPPHVCRFLTFSQQSTGRIHDGLPWHHLPTKDRLDKLDKLASAFAKDEPNLDNHQAEARARDLYNCLRGVVEKGVEEVVFCGTLERYNDYVRVASIKQTVGLKLEECEPLVDLHSRASDIIAGHDKSGARAFAAPNAKEARDDVEKLKKALDTIRDRRKASKSTTPP